MTEKIAELIQLYKDFPCLWNTSSECYKDIKEKNSAWSVMATKFKEIEQDANVASVKKKIDNLKSAYKREVRKVKAFKQRQRSGSASTKKVYKPNLWYYELMTFLDMKSEQQGHRQNEIDSCTSDDKSQHNDWSVNREERKSEKRKRNFEDAAHTQKSKNSFAQYVGEQLEYISSSQRPIAEKLISEVIFLAKTENLNFFSRIQTPNVSNPAFPAEFAQNFTSSLQQSSSPRIIKSSPSHQFSRSASSSPTLLIKTYSHKTIETPFQFQAAGFSAQKQSATTSLEIVQSPSSSKGILETEKIEESDEEGPKSTLLKELLVSNNTP